MSEAKCNCQHCNGHIAFPTVMVGQMFDCPHCKMETQLYIPSVVTVSARLQPMPRPGESRKPHPAVLASVIIAGAIILSTVGFLVFNRRNPSPSPGPSVKVEAPTKAELPAAPEPTANVAPVLKVALAPVEEVKTLRYPPLTEAERTQAARTITILKADEDAVEGITWYKFESPPLQSDIHLYIGKFNTGQITLRLVIRYYGEDWIFMRKFPVRTSTGLFTIIPTEEIARNNGSRHVWETYDELARDNISIIEKMIVSPDCILRMEGERSEDLYLTASQRIRLAQMILVYRYWGGNFEK
jgi:hypothetical protein